MAVALSIVLTSLGLGRHAVLLAHPILFAKVWRALHLIMMANGQLTALAFRGEVECLHLCRIHDKDLNLAAIPTYICCTWPQQVVRYKSLVYGDLCISILLCAGNPDGVPLQTNEYDVGSWG